MNQAFLQEANNRQGSQKDADLTLSQVMGSVFAAGFGVQSRDNKVRDFSRGKPLQFVIAGLTFTIALLLALVAIVNLVV